ncbi:hypothetical protein [Prosthecobacter sp.]|uniref:hypothetical protein n=1 Tax=Prosthecobacter sp. TaxID=1965333 RepID=UPI002ABA13C8|nr:hypothetical protein [Prosthecobacter sp.]MDZ4402614.1 hypothetical protein [Prosthecobacter sp.]
MLHSLLDTTKVIHTVEIAGATYELCAEAVANHDRHGNQLTVNLRAFLRAMRQDHIGETAVPVWLPPPQSITEHVDAGEAHELANDVFSSWCHKVADAAPPAEV